MIEWHETLFLSLTQHAHHARRQVYVLNAQPDELAQSQPRRVKQLEDRAVAAAERIDLREHDGLHPRVGALDVAPVVYLDDDQRGAAIAEALLAGGRDAGTPVAVVMEGTMPEERTVFSTLGSLADDIVEHTVKPPAIIVVGDVVAVANPARYARG